MRALNSINFQHLLYFWTVAREGGVLRAAQQLNVSASAVSTQLRALERSLGVTLFHRRGRRLALTDAGELVLRYADDMFSAASELTLALEGRTTSRPQRLTVGISDALPKLTTVRLLEPAFAAGAALNVTLRIDKTARLLGDLSVHALDLVIADEPVAPSLNVRAFNHLLGECGVTVFAVPTLARRHARDFPRSLDGAPVILQATNTALRRSLDQFFAREGLRPTVVAEVEDLGLLQELGGQGLGLFAAPSVVERNVCERYRVKVVGRLPSVIERFFAISVERKLRNPAVVAISTAARDSLFR